MDEEELMERAEAYAKNTAARLANALDSEFTVS